MDVQSRNMRAAILLSFAFVFPAVLARADTFDVVKEDSIFAVVTHKAGLAARFAHNHLVYPADYTCRIDSPSGQIEQLRFELEFPATGLVSDLPDAQKKWYPAIQRAGILDKPFVEVSESDRASILEHMLAKGQLDAAAYPKIAVRLTGLKRETNKRGDTEYAWLATIAFTVHGKTVERGLPASIRLESGKLTVDAAGSFAFTEFGITPYSAMLGAVRNQDAFDVYVHLEAKRRAESTSDENKE